VSGDVTQARVFQTVNLADISTLNFQRELGGWTDDYPPGTFSVNISNTEVSSEDCLNNHWLNITQDINGFEGSQEISFIVATVWYGAWAKIDDVSILSTEDPLPIADFTATPLTGTAPLTVQFTDTSANTPTSWSWDFGDGNSTNSTQQNPVHQYSSAGTYTVSLTAANAAGSDGETKPGYVTVTEQTDFYVYAEGVGLYHGTQDDLSLGNTTPGDFYNYLLNHQCGTVDPEKCWYGRGLFVDDNAGSVHWSSAEQAGSYADNADFVFFVGHGWKDRIYFGTQNSVLELEEQYMSFGEGKAKWVTLDSCYVLNESTQTNWESMFNGLHILNGFDTMGLLYDYQGTKYAQMLTGTGGGYDRKSIRTAWREMLQETIEKNEINGAYMWANPCSNDFLPGFGDYCSAPTKSGLGEYDITWMNFECDYA